MTNALISTYLFYIILSGDTLMLQSFHDFTFKKVKTCFSKFLKIEFVLSS